MWKGLDPRRDRQCNAASSRLDHSLVNHLLHLSTSLLSIERLLSVLCPYTFSVSSLRAKKMLVAIALVAATLNIQGVLVPLGRPGTLGRTFNGDNQCNIKLNLSIKLHQIICQTSKVVQKYNKSVARRYGSVCSVLVAVVVALHRCLSRPACGECFCTTMWSTRSSTVSSSPCFVTMFDNSIVERAQTACPVLDEGALV